MAGSSRRLDGAAARAKQDAEHHGAGQHRRKDLAFYGHGAAGDVARNMLSTVVGNFFPPMAMLATAPILARALGVDSRGEVAAATAPLILVIAAATFGIPDAITFAIAKNRAVARHATRLAAALIAVAGLMATGVAILASSWLSGGNYQIQQLSIVASLAIVPNLLIAVLRGTASGLHLWRRVAVERVVSAAVRLIAMVVLMFASELNAMSATIVIAAGPLLGAVAYFRLPMFPEPGGNQAAAMPMGDLIGFGLRVWVGSISGILLLRLDQAIMTPLSSEYQLGLYAVAATIADIPLIVNRAVRDVTFSADATKATDSRLGTSARLSSAMSAALGLVAGVTMFWWLPWLFGEDFTAALPVTVLLLLAAVLGAPGSIAGAGLSSRGRPGLRSSALVVACTLNVILLFILVPRYGAMGAAWATLFGNLVSSNANIFFLWRIYRISPREFYGFRRDDWRVGVRFLMRMMHGKLRGRS